MACILLILCLMTAVFSACGKSEDGKTTQGETASVTESVTENSTEQDDEPETLPALINCGIIHEPEFGGVYITKTIEDFNALGFHFGDSVNVYFSNGYKLTDLPYYNGYYTRTGSPLLIGYPGYDYIKAAINNAADLWDVAGLTESDTATITLFEAGKYLNIQSARDLAYLDDREKFDSDEVFANFRTVNVGGIRENTLYRSASPCDNQHNRAPYVDRLMGDAGVKYIINLADNEEKIAAYMAADGFNSPNFAALYADGRVMPLALNMNFESERFRSGVVKGLQAMLDNDGPFLVHCTEGKDRTGFFCMLIEALCGASYDEIVEDYMITYDNYYQITKERDPEKYAIIVSEVLDPMIQILTGNETENLREADLSRCAEEYLAGIGFSSEQAAQLKAKLTGR